MAEYCKFCGNKLTAQQEIKSTVTDRPAGFWIRTFSELIDIVVVLILIKMAGFTAPVGLNYIIGSDISENFYIREGILLVSLAAIVFIVIFYEIWMHVRFGQTLGKMATGIRVITIDNAPVPYKLSLLRCIGKIINVLTCGIGFIMVAVSRQKRGLHDLIGNTSVYYVKK
ncbi:MAG: RDD family protein [Elusimicrobiota bacterium]